MKERKGNSSLITANITIKSRRKKKNIPSSSESPSLSFGPLNALLISAVDLKPTRDNAGDNVDFLGGPILLAADL